MDEMKREAEAQAQAALRNAGTVGGFVGGGIGGAVAGALGGWIAGKFQSTDFETRTFKVRASYKDACAFVQVAAFAVGLPDKPTETTPDITKFFIVRKKGFLNIPVSALGVAITPVDDQVTAVEVIASAKSGRFGSNGAHDYVNNQIADRSASSNCVAL